MLYSEIKERENRFITALKIVFPFLLLLALFFFLFEVFNATTLTIILLILLIPVYVYYAVYLIYYGFQTTLIDPITKTFTRKQIEKRIQSLLNKKKECVILCIQVDNLEDINERYGISNAETLLHDFIQKLASFLEEHHFKNVLIGRYNYNSFLLSINHSQKELSHFMMLFSKSVQNVGINNIEVKIVSSMVHGSYDLDVQIIIERLFMLIEEQKKDEPSSNIKLNEFKSIIHEILKNESLSFRYQPVYSSKNKAVTLFEVLTKFESKTHGILSKQQLQRIVNHTGYEKEFDIRVLTLLIKEIKSHAMKEALFSIEISAVSLRSSQFKHFLTTLFDAEKIQPSQFIFEINEIKSYEELRRFREIINAYHELGFKIALGNFGGNNASLEYLKSLPIDMIKFDIEFTKKADEIKYELLLKHFIELARVLHIQSMVKFIDKEALFEKIKAYEPDFIQGFYISKPKKIGELNEIR